MPVPPWPFSGQVVGWDDGGYAAPQRDIFAAGEGGPQVAQKVSVTYACDYDEKEIPDGQQRSITFGLDGQEYEIDLCAKHSERFSEVVGKFAEHARKTSVRNTGKRRRRTAANRQRSAEIRAWAKQSGFEVSDRGRIPGHVLAGFETEAKRA
jgi:nucleoid-associated protein Lsr2